QLLADGPAVRIGGVLERLDVVRAQRQRDLGGLAHEVLELFVLGDEVGLRIHLDRDAAGAVYGHADEAFGSGAARLLGRGGEPPGAQRVDRRLDVAAGLVERLLAVHHAGAGALAQVLNVGCSVSHGTFLEVGGERGPPRWARGSRMQSFRAVTPRPRPRRQQRRRPELQTPRRWQLPPAALPSPRYRLPNRSPLRCGRWSPPRRPRRSRDAPRGWRRRCPGSGRRCPRDRRWCRGSPLPGCRARWLP